MNRLLILLFLVLSHVNSTATLIRSISIKSFGAKGDGKTNDQDAFIKASDYINKEKQNIKLMIPYGIYIVGRQTPGTEWLLDGADVIHLVDCKNIIIEGELKNGQYPKIKYKNGLYFGSFYAEGEQKLNPKCEPNADYYNKKTCAYIGTCFHIQSSSQISISSIEIDGNQNGMILGGYYGDKGRQLNHRGFYLIQSQSITLQNISVHHMALDGIEISGSENTIITNLRSTYNGRQGISWTGGNGLHVSNSSFNNTGTSRISTAPGAGMDIEPENNSDITNGVFDHCEFMNNAGCAVVNERNKFNAVNMEFNDCTFLGYHNFALWVWGRQFRFNDCHIYGYCTNAVNAIDVTATNDITTFKRCLFSNAYKNKLTRKVSGYLLEFNNQSVNIENSKIESYNVGFMWHSGGLNPEIAKSHVINTFIITNNTKAFHCSTSGIKFSNCTVLYTEKVDISLDGADPKENTISSHTVNELNRQMKSTLKVPYVNTINPYICTEH